MAEELELLPGIGEFDTGKLMDLGFTEGDVERMVSYAIADARVVIEAERALDEDPQ